MNRCIKNWDSWFIIVSLNGSNCKIFSDLFNIYLVGNIDVFVNFLVYFLSHYTALVQDQIVHVLLVPARLIWSVWYAVTKLMVCKRGLLHTLSYSKEEFFADIGRSNRAGIMIYARIAFFCIVEHIYGSNKMFLCCGAEHVPKCSGVPWVSGAWGKKWNLRPFSWFFSPKKSEWYTQN